MCGIVAINSNHQVSHQLYESLIALQHRGQDAAGMLTCDEHNHLSLHKANGLVKDVFKTSDIIRLQGNKGIAHIRYPTAGTSSQAEAQPFYVNSPFGIALAHNGNLINSKELAQEIYNSDRRHINTASDSEVLLNILAHELQKTQNYSLSKQDIYHAVENLYQRCIGGYAAVALIVGHGIIGFRDIHGIRPLVYGYKLDPANPSGAKQYMIASESVALDMLGFTLIGDVKPGEIIYIDNNGELHQYQSQLARPATPCIFEYVYLARPDSIFEGISIYKARLYMGEMLAENIKKDFVKRNLQHDIDVVMPVPDTSRTSAITLSYHLGVKFREGLIKNHYIGRTFIMPDQKLRKRSVRQKLNAVVDEFKNKNILLVDDSIVRGTTSKEIVQLARDAGANKVYFASASPPVRYPNVYGIDMPAHTDFIAHNRTHTEIEQYLGADRIFYQELEDLKSAIKLKNPNLQNFDASVFNGEYITGGVDADYFNYLLSVRAARHKYATNNHDNIDNNEVGVEVQNLVKTTC